MKRLIIVIILNIAMFFCFYQNYKSDIFFMEFGTNMFEYVSTLSQTDSEIEKGSVELDEESDYRGKISRILYDVLNPGEYSFTIDYDTTSENDYVEVYSESSAGKTIYYESNLIQDKSACQFFIKTDENIYDLSISFTHNGGSLYINSMYIAGLKPYTDWIVLGCIILIAEAILYTLFRFYKKRNEITQFKILILLSGVALFASMPYLNGYLPDCGHDIPYQLGRIEGIVAALKEFPRHIPLRIDGYEQGGYGYAIPIFYPYIFLYIPALIKLLGTSMLFAYKFFIIVINIATAVIMYYTCSRLLTNRSISVIASALYTMSMYRLIDVYTRGALGEVLAMTFMPLVLLGIYEILIGDKKKWYLAAIGFTCVLQSHILSVEMCGIFCIIFLIWHMKDIVLQPDRILYLIKAGVMTLLLNLWFLVPFISYSSLELQVFNDERDLHSSSIWVSQMFQSFNGYEGDSLPLNINLGEMPLSIGVILLFGCVLFIYAYSKETRKAKERLWNIGKEALILGMTALFLTCDLFPWEWMQQMPYINKIMSVLQYPWRYLAVATVFLCISSAIGIDYCLASGKKINRNMIVAICIICFCSSYYLDSIAEARGCPKGEVEKKSLSDNLYLFTDTYQPNLSKREHVIVLSGNGDIEFQNVKNKYAGLEADIVVNEVNDDCYMEIPLYWYPGYTAATDRGETLTVSRSETGMVYIPAPLEDCHLTISYEEPVLWKIASIISLLVILCWSGGSIVCHAAVIGNRETTQ